MTTTTTTTIRCSPLNRSDMNDVIQVRDPVMQIDAASWLAVSKHVPRHTQGPRPEEGCGRLPLVPDGHARRIHDAGDVSAVFSFGESLIVKARIADNNTRRESETLAFLAAEKEQLSFDSPPVLFYDEDAG
ncbi:hypothetical protein VTK26DRAFT_9224 [Humicola hyalothermophila]